jgi:hypothetical protein
MDARDKLLAEAGLTETKVILGWLFDFRQLQISLPENKFIAWTANVNKLIAEGITTTKELKSTIGHLGHLALVVPGVHHFLAIFKNYSNWPPTAAQFTSMRHVWRTYSYCFVSLTLQKKAST